jgi:hypothetical protein
LARRIDPVEGLIAPDTLKKGTWVTDPSDDLLAAVRAGYEEAAGRAVAPSTNDGQDRGPNLPA